MALQTTVPNAFRGGYSIAYELLFTDTDRQKLLDNHDQEVLDSFNKKLERKRKELQWVDKRDKVLKRFWNSFGKNNVHFIEMKFEAHNKNHRGVFVLVDEEKKLVYIGSVRKEGDYMGSSQDKLLKSCFANAQRIKDRAAKIVVEQAEA